MEIEDETVKYCEPLKEFRERMSDVLKPEYNNEYLLRWLKSKNFDQKKAENLFRQCLRYRYTYQVDTLPEKYKVHELMMKYGFLGFLGFDKTGAAIRYIAEGKGDYDGFCRCFSMLDICLYSSYVIECDMKAIRENNTKTGKNGKQEMLTILDLEGFTLQQMAHKHVLETGFDLMKIFQDFYTPEILKRVIIINAPVYFSVAYNIFKPIMRQNLIEKLEVYSSKESSFNALLKYIDPEVLPVFLGGTCVDENGDPNCSAFIRQGGKIPQTYFKPIDFLSLSEPDVKELILYARSSYDLIVEVLEPGSMFKMEFCSDNAFGLSIHYKIKAKGTDTTYENGFQLDDAIDREESVSPYAKVQAHVCPLDSVIHCERAGEYIFRFDNTFSWVTSKRIIYRIQVLPPS